MIKLSNYYVVQGYMITLLKLKGLELQVYAIIKGFSQNESNYYTAPLSYIAEFTGTTKQGVLKALKCLIDKGYIIKEDHTVNNVKMPKYKAVIPSDLRVSTEFNPIKLSLTGGSTEFNTQIIKNNSIISNNYNNKEISKQNTANDADIKELLSLLDNL